jgi:hypothetical protein
MERDRRKQGSAKVLEGRIYVLTIITGDRQWSQNVTDSVFGMIRTAQQWLSQQASRYGKTVTFENGCFGHPTPIAFDIASGTGSGKESVDVIWQLMKKIGYERPIDFTTWAKEKAGCDSSLVLVFADKPGRSYAISYHEDYDKEKYYLEGVVLFTKYNTGCQLMPAGIAHEICHLFGAEDLYETFKQTKENELLARKLYPNDIMLRVSYNINELRIDEMTARFMGLTDVEKQWYKQFLNQK